MESNDVQDSEYKIITYTVDISLRVHTSDDQLW